jgi:hypothetical protein
VLALPPYPVPLALAVGFLVAVHIEALTVKLRTYFTQRHFDFSRTQTGSVSVAEFPHPHLVDRHRCAFGFAHNPRPHFRSFWLRRAPHLRLLSRCRQTHAGSLKMEIKNPNHRFLESEVRA